MYKRHVNIWTNSRTFRSFGNFIREIAILIDQRSFNSHLTTKFDLGSGEAFSIGDTTDDYWNRVIAINLTAPFVLTRHFLPQMKAKSECLS